MATAARLRSEAAHHSLIYQSPEEFLAAAVPFLRDGIAMDAPVVAILAEENRRLAADALGDDAGAVEWADAADWYRYPTQALRCARDFTARQGDRAGQVRLLGELVWAERSALERTEWARYEALVNVAFPDTPAVCAYDARAVDEVTLASVAQTHPSELLGTTVRPNPDYVDPADYVRRCDAQPLSAPPSDAAHVFFSEELRAVRHCATAVATDARVESDRAADLVVAVNEAATNAVEHGGGRGTLRAWTTPAELVCEITNPTGHIADPFPGHLPPDPLADRGRGLWLIRQLTDLTEIRSDPHGVTVRMSLFRNGQSPQR